MEEVNTAGGMSAEAIRKDQSAHHRKTLTANRRSKRSSPGQGTSKKSRQSRQPDAHERHLQMLQDDARPVSLFTQGGIIMGRITSFDRFTITLKANFDGSMRSTIIFKHSIHLLTEVTENELLDVATGDEASGE